MAICRHPSIWFADAPCKCYTLVIFCFILHFAVLVSGTYDGKSFDGNLQNKIHGYPCTRLFTTTESLGCRSPEKSGTIGVLYEIRNEHDIQKSKDLTVDFIAVLPGNFFDATVVDTLRHRGLKGILVLPDQNSSVSYFANGNYSPDVLTPQGQGTVQEAMTINASYPWNQHGNGLMYQDLPFPIVYLDSSSAKDVKDWTKDNRNTGFDNWPLYVADMQFYMGPKYMTSQKCLDWRDHDGHKDPQCLPLGGQSVWATHGTFNQKPKLLVTTGMDSVATFHDLAYGVNDAVSSVVALLAVADAFHMVNASLMTHQLMFVMAQADEWAYAGSRRFVNDITSFSCANGVEAATSPSGLPMCLDPVYPSTLFTSIGMQDISAIVAVDQVGIAAASSTNDDKEYSFYIHALEASQSTAKQFIDATADVDHAIVASSSQSALPPTGADVYVQASPHLPTLVFAGYDSAYIDSRFHTHADTSTQVSVEAVTAAANALARGLFALAGGDITNTDEADLPVVKEWLVSALMDCLTTSWECGFMQGYYHSEQRNLADTLNTGSVTFPGGSKPPNYYVGVISATQHGLPVVQHETSVYTRYTQPYNPSTDMVYMVPNQFEAFVRAFLMSELGNTSIGVSCTTSSECGTCQILQYQAAMECVLNLCVCPNSFYHLAMDPGITPRTSPNTFTVTDETSPAYTEPYWSNLRVRVYLSAGDTIGYVVLGLGLFVAVGSLVGSAWVVQLFKKQKVL